MNVYLYRHADALDGNPDAERPLSEKGLLQIERMARFLKGKKNFKVAEVWHSPLLRAQDTAKRFTQLMGIAQLPMLTVPGLEPYKAVDTLAEAIRERNCDLLVVGHQPQLEQLAVELLHGDPAWTMFSFKKGAILALQYKDSVWQIRWMLTAGLLK